MTLAGIRSPMANVGDGAGIESGVTKLTDQTYNPGIQLGSLLSGAMLTHDFDSHMLLHEFAILRGSCTVLEAR